MGEKKEENGERTRENNIFGDSETANRFIEIATAYAGIKRLKNAPIFSFMTVEDVVMESVKKVIQQGICYDPNRGCKFETFVRMIVSSVFCDLDRKTKKYQSDTSLDSVVYSRDEDMESTTVGSFEEDKNNFVELCETEGILESCTDDFNSVDLGTILKMKASGYTVREVARSVGIRPKYVKGILSCMEEVVESRIKSDRTLADILYGDEDELERVSDRLIKTLSYIKDMSSGIILSDIVRLVIDGYSYRGIGEELGTSKDEIKSILDRYESIGM